MYYIEKKIGLLAAATSIALITDRKMWNTMETSYHFMKELSGGYHRGKGQIKLKYGEVNFQNALSEFIQTMYYFPWRKLRENLDEKQLEQLFKVFAELPQGLDQMQDMSWSLCVTFRRIFDLPTDYCIPSRKYPSARLIIHMKEDILSKNTSIFDVEGVYFEKGIPKCFEIWHNQRRNQIVNDLHSIEYKTRREVPLINGESTENIITLQPKVYEKFIYPVLVDETESSNSDSFQMRNVFDLLNGINLLLINRNILHNDYHWYLDYVHISYLHTFSNKVISFNPMQIAFKHETSDDSDSDSNESENEDEIVIVLKTVKVRFQLFDEYPQFHTYIINDSNIRYDIDLETEQNMWKMINKQKIIRYIRSDILSPSDMTLTQKRHARRYVLVMDREKQEWRLLYTTAMDSNDCIFRATMNKALQQKTSWILCEQGIQSENVEVPPIIYFGI